MTATPTRTARIRVFKGDITKIQADAIVNAANETLMGGGGVDGAIHRAGGPAIFAECRVIRDRQGGCATGKAVITTAGKLPAKYVIHTVGPVWQGGSRNEAELLRSCYLESLALAAQHNARSIAFPNISTGIYHFPKPAAARIARAAVAGSPHTAALDEVIFVCFDDENFALYDSP